MKNILVITGGAGFVGSNLIFELLKFKKFKIIKLKIRGLELKKQHLKTI